MDPEAFARARAAAAAAVSMVPSPALRPHCIAWRRTGRSLELLWPDGSPWVRYEPLGDVHKGLVARVATEAFRRMHRGLGEAASPLLGWLASRPSTGASVAELPLFLLPDVVAFDPRLDLDLDLAILPPGGFS